MSRDFLADEHDIFREALQKFLEKEATPNYEQWERDKGIPRSFWKKAGEQGFLCPQIDEKYGGSNTDFSYAVVLSEEFDKVGKGLTGIGLHNDIVMPYIIRHGTDEQKQRWLPKATTGELISAIAMTEPGTGSDLANVKTTAKKDGDDYIVNGEKTFITNGSSADLVVVVCKTDTQADPAHRGISLLVVEEGMPGFQRGTQLEKVGQHASDTSELIFEDVRVPASNLLGEENKGFYYLMENLQQERLIVAISSVASAEKIVDLTVNYVKEREAFGRPISTFQNTQFKLAEMKTKVELSRAFVDDLIEDHMAGKEVVDRVSMAKWWTTDLEKEVATECMQLHGGYGYMEEYKIARRYRDAAVTSIYAGTNEIMKNIIAKNMGL